jgi:hypothetical protein
MKSLSVSLSARVLANIEAREECNGFDFIIGESHY